MRTAGNLPRVIAAMAHATLPKKYDKIHNIHNYFLDTKTILQASTVCVSFVCYIQVCVADVPLQQKVCDYNEIRTRAGRAHWISSPTP